MNLLGDLAYDHELWGDSAKGKDNPLFGFVRAGTRFGGSPTLSGYFQLVPISPVVFEIERGMTQRLSRTTNFPCESVECRGRIDRTDVSVRLAGAYKDLVFLGGMLWRDLKTMDSATDVMIELEDLVVAPGNHRFVEANAFVGLNVGEHQTAGILYSSGEIKDSSRGFQSTYALYRTKLDDYTIAAGAGTYKSDFDSLTGFSAIFSLSRQWGSSMGLF
jgi:hypothetical protein